MFKNYLKIAFRALWKEKSYALINVLGLAAGMACCILMLLYVQDEISYDDFHEDADQIYRVAMTIETRGVPTHFAPTMGPLAEALVNDYAEIDEVVQILPGGTAQVSSRPEEIFYEDKVFLADPGFFRVFSFPLLSGDPATVLNQPDQVALKRSLAEKYFDNDPLGKRLRVNSNEYVVSGVFEDPPENSHFKPAIIGSLNRFRQRGFMQNWHANIVHTYIKTRDGVQGAALSEKISKIADRYVGDQIRNNNQDYTYFLQPITDIHLNSNLRYELEANSRAVYVYIFSIIAALVLLISCINFMNLATAKSARRAKEVGMRKVIGARRGQLVRQFLGESLLFSLFAAVLAMGLVELFMPTFNHLAAKSLDFSLARNGALAIGIALIAVFVGLLAGSYPAFFISSFPPIETVKGKMGFGKGGNFSRAALLRRGLVVLQFAISIALIAGTMLISGQLNFLRQQNLGFDKEQILALSVRGSSDLPQRYEEIKSAFLQQSSVLGATASHSVPGRGVSNNLIGDPQDPENRVQMNLLFVDHDFLKTYAVELLAGRDFSREITTDVNGRVALMNEAAVKAFGWPSPDSALGKQFTGFTNPRAIGVVKDFHFKSLHETVAPLMMLLRPRNFQYISLKISSGDPSELLTHLEQQWKELLPDAPFEYFFLDEDFDKQYRAEQRLSEIFNAFAVLAIFIGCLGLFGLASYAAEQRTKEIGVRKVLGAGVPGLIVLLSKEFAWLVGIALAVAVPVCYFAIDSWLQNFAYRNEISWWIFAMAGGLALAIALLTVSAQAVRAALANPVESLRYE